jgi:hypothetical protein
MFLIINCIVLFIIYLETEHGSSNHKPIIQCIFPMFEVTLRLTVSQSVCLGIEHPCGTSDQILLPVGMLLSEIRGLVSIGRPLLGEDGFAICGVITQ